MSVNVYDPSTSTLTKVAGNTNTNINKISKAEYEALSEEDKNNGIYCIIDDYADNNASTIEYSNTTSGLSSTTVQDAIDELNSNLEGEFVSLGNNGGYKKVGNVVTVNTYFVVGTTEGAHVLASNLPMPVDIAALSTIEIAHGTSIRAYINKNRELIVLEPLTHTTNRVYITGSYICV